MNAIIITTINRPTEAIAGFAKFPGWKLFVVGDKKTPKEWETKISNVEYLSFDRQQSDFSELCKYLPANSYVRKNVGYFAAIKSGAQLILESDDDNIPYDYAEKAIRDELEDETGFTSFQNACGWINVYGHFTSEEIWPRGFPLEYINQSELDNRVDENGVRLGITQFLADEDPDVDAIYRMTNGRLVNFERNKRVVLAKNCLCPFNSQATLWRRHAFSELPLPVGVSDRVTDILRSYLTIPALWAMNQRIAFSGPIVRQLRNPHKYLDDFAQEVPLYLNAHRWSILIKSIVGAGYRTREKRLSLLGFGEDMINSNTAIGELFEDALNDV